MSKSITQDMAYRQSLMKYTDHQHYACCPVQTLVFLFAHDMHFLSEAVVSVSPIILVRPEKRCMQLC